MRSSDRLVGSASRQCVEQFHEAGFVRVARGAFAIRLDPFGMLNPQIVVNLLPKLGVGVNLARHGHWLGERFKCSGGRFVELAPSMSALSSETNEFHKRPFVWGLTVPNPRGRRTILTRFQRPRRFGRLGSS